MRRVYQKDNQRHTCASCSATETCRYARYISLQTVMVSDGAQSGQSRLTAFKQLFKQVDRPSNNYLSRLTRQLNHLDNQKDLPLADDVRQNHPRARIDSRRPADRQTGRQVRRQVRRQARTEKEKHAHTHTHAHANKRTNKQTNKPTYIHTYIQCMYICWMDCHCFVVRASCWK